MKVLTIESGRTFSFSNVPGHGGIYLNRGKCPWQKGNLHKNQW